ncbi:MAG: glycosyltransferase family 87 protein [Candidatus Dormibacteraceae bacterium]
MPRPTTGALRRYGLFTLAVISVWWLGFISIREWFPTFPTAPVPSDFSLYFGAARILLAHGPQAIYSMGLQHAQFVLIHPPKQPFDVQTIFVTPPPMAWLVASLAWLPYSIAYWIWCVLMASAYAAVGLILVPGGWLQRVAVVLSGLATYLVLTNIRDGQVAMLVGLATGLAWWLLKRGRPVLAGICLSVLILKPQVAYLVPFALFLWGARRFCVAWVASSAIWVVASVVSLGVGGIAVWRADLGLENKNLGNQVWTPAIFVGSGYMATGIEVAAGAFTLLIAWRFRSRALAMPFVAALVGSALAFNYHHGSDYFALVVAFWLYLHCNPPRWQWVWLGFGCATALLSGPWGPQPIIIFTAGWLLILGYEAFWGQAGALDPYPARPLSRVRSAPRPAMAPSPEV